MPRANSKLVWFLALAGIGLSVLMSIVESVFYSGSGRLNPINLETANCGFEAVLAFIGLVALAIARCLKNIENRLTEIENIQTQSPKK
jgi:hypothetical protein